MIATDSVPQFAPASSPVAHDVLLTAEPLLTTLRGRARREIAQFHRTASCPFGDVDALTAAVAGEVDRAAFDVVRGVFALELNLARLAGRLTGGTPEQRYADFVARLRTHRGRRDVLSRYPALPGVLRRTCTARLSSVLTLLARLARDWTPLRDTFAAAATAGPLIGLDGVGDPHHGGQLVTTLRFLTGWRLVYKPRSLAPDQHYQELLAWTGTRGWEPAFRSVSMLLADGHGWTEYVDAAACGSAAAVRRFYRRSGGHLAVLHALAGADMHQDNLLAAGEHPVLVDLEALFQAPVADLPCRPDPMTRSVLQVGLLPTRTGTRPAGGALGAGAPEHDAALEWGCTGAGTDEMALVPAAPPASFPRHRPTSGGRPVDFHRHRDDVLTGFEDMYRLLVEHRDDLLADDGPIAAFALDPVRVITRPTALYGRVIEASRHPDALRTNAGPRATVARVRRLLDTAPGLAALVAAEQRDLLDGDIPRFTARAGSRDVDTGRGTRSPDTLERSGIRTSRDRIAGFGARDLARQRRAVEAAYALARGAPTPDPGLHREVSTLRVGDERRRLLAQARRIGDRVMTLADDDRGALGWLGVRQDTDSAQVAAMGPQLYDGTLGVCLFLAQLGLADRQRDLLDTALRSIRVTTDRLLDGPPAVHGVGGFSGWGGVLFVLTHARRLAPARATGRWTALIRHALDRIDGDLDADEDHDVVGGAAGAVLALLACSETELREHTLAVAVRAGDRLLASAVATRSGLGWTRPDGTGPLSGFAHGCAGVALALDRLATATGRPDFGCAARRALAHERTMFRPRLGNWLDVRRGGADPVAVAWCHGAPGIGLARLHGSPDTTARHETTTALATTVAHLGRGGLSLCHGDAGRLELMLQASRHRPHLVTTSVVDGHRQRFLARIEQAETPDLELESPALMTGLAGVGHALLRLRDPDRVPSVLTLAPPCPRGTRGAGHP